MCRTSVGGIYAIVEKMYKGSSTRAVFGATGALLVAVGSVVDTVWNTLQALIYTEANEKAKDIITALERLLEKCKTVLEKIEDTIDKMTEGEIDDKECMRTCNNLLVVLENNIERADIHYTVFRENFDEWKIHQQYKLENRKCNSEFRQVFKLVAGIGLLGGATMVTCGAAAVIAGAGFIFC